MKSRDLTRRGFLAGAVGLSASAALAACGGGSSDGSGNPETEGGSTSASSGPASAAGTQSPSSSAVEGPKLPPTRVPFTGVKADLPAGDHGIPAGFYHYPANPPAFAKHSLGSGDTVSFLLQQGDAPATPMSKNAWWTNLNSKVNATLKVDSIIGAQYTAKFQTTIAGGDLPDVVQIVTVNGLAELLEKDFADLTDYLGGDAIKAYPGLASIPTATWQIPTLNGRLWGVTQPRPSAGQIATVRGDLLPKFGLDESALDISSGADFTELCKNLTDSKRGRYAIGEQPNTWILNAVLEMMGAPNGWTVNDGKFTSIFESAQMKDALSHVKSLWDAGYIHPDSFATPGSNYVWWSGGITTIYFQGFTGWSSYANLHPSWKIGVLTAPKWDGGGIADKVLGQAGYGAFVALKKASDSRIKEILNILDYIAAPFGTQEFLDVNYGKAGVDYTLDGTDPVLTKTGGSDDLYHLQYCGAQGRVNLYLPGNDELVKDQYDYLSKVLPNGVSNPAWGLFSPAALNYDAKANKGIRDAQADIIQGRKPMSSWDSALETWKKTAGDAERSDYEKGYAAANGGS
jgi:putative aldouronate transport system substrate-binding protein